MGCSQCDLHLWVPIDMINWNWNCEPGNLDLCLMLMCIRSYVKVKKNKSQPQDWVFRGTCSLIRLHMLPPTLFREVTGSRICLTSLAGGSQKAETTQAAEMWKGKIKEYLAPTAPVIAVPLFSGENSTTFLNTSTTHTHLKECPKLFAHGNK